MKKKMLMVVLKRKERKMTTKSKKMENEDDDNSGHGEYRILLSYLHSEKRAFIQYQTLSMKKESIGCLIKRNSRL